MEKPQIIRRNYPFNKDNFIGLNLMFWEFTWLKSTKHIKGLAYASLTLLTLGFLAMRNNELNPFLGLGIAFAIFGLILFLLRQNSKKTCKRIAHQVAKRLEINGLDNGYELSDLTFKHWDSEKQFTLNWSAIKSCSVYKDHLILHIDNGPYANFIFDKKEDCLDDFDQVLEFLTSKITVQEVS